MEATAASFLPDDVVLEILHRLSTDVTTLFRCATTCKRWRDLVADRSFISRVWPENVRHQSCLVGFFDRQPHGRMDHIGSPYPLFFVPPPAGSVLGARRRFLASFISGLPDGFFNGADALAAHGGILLVRLHRASRWDSIHMAVCDLLAGTCNVLPPIECKVAFLSCAIVTGADCFASTTEQQHGRRTSSQGYSTIFKVLTVVVSSHKEEDKECNLYTFSSAQPSWSAPTKCFDEIRRILRLHHGLSFQRGFWFLMGNKSVVRRSMAHWLVPYYSDNIEEFPTYYTYNVCAKSGHASKTEISIPGEQLDTIAFGTSPTLSVDVDESLLLLCLFMEDGISRLDMWKQGNHIDSKVWLLTRVVEVKPPRREWSANYIDMWLGDKSGILLIMDEFWCVHRVDIATGSMEEEKFRNGLHQPVPIEIDLSVLFSSRLGQVEAGGCYAML